MLTILTLSLMLSAGCASTKGKDMPFQEGVDHIGFEQGQEMGKAPVRGSFYSDNYHKFEQEKCK